MSPTIVAALVMMAVAMAVAGIGLMFVRDKSRLEQALQPYDVQARAAAEDSSSREVTLVESKLLQRAVESTGRIARERGLMEVIEKKLDQADLPLRSAEALFVFLVALGVLTLGGLALGGLFGGFVALVIGGLLPVAVLNGLASNRQRKFVSQLPDTLQLLASSLRAGYSFLQGLDTVSQESAEPMGSELRRVIAEARLGRPVDEALAECGRRMRSPDFDWAVMAIGIQREVGGNLAELLVTVSETMIARERLRRDVKSLTAEGKLSAVILGCLPIGLGGVMYTMNPDYIGTLFTTGTGKMMLAAATVLALIGFWWMKKSIVVEV